MRTKSTLRRLTIETLESRQLLAFNPTGFEQELLEHTNRMRMNPSEELGVLFDSQPQPLVATDPHVQTAIQYFSVDGTVLKTQWEQLRPASPLAWNPSLLNAARGHSQAMIAHNRLSHQLPGEAPLGTRIIESGYGPYRAVAENAFAHAQSPMHAHAGFAIDWGGTPSGIQDGHGHRTNLMNPAYTEIGIGVLQQDAAPGKVGPLVVTQNFARPVSAMPYLLGVVYEDTNENGRYDAGEGLAGIPVHVRAANGAAYTTQTMSAGGYQLQVPAGTYQVSIALPDSPESTIVDQVAVAASNVKVDLVFEAGDAELALQSPWQNPEDRCDVNGDGFITPQDALLIINLLTERGPYRLADAPWDGKWWDVSGDGLVTALDALIVINRLNQWGSHPALPSSVSDPERLDTDQNGKIDQADAQFVIDYLDGNKELCSTCDVNDDGRVSPLDALLIWNHVMAKEGVKTSDPAYVLGVVYADIDEDDQYSQGEGIAGIPVRFRGEGHHYSVLTTSNGFYELNVLPGTYEVTAFPPGLRDPLVIRQTLVAGESALMDFMIGTSLPVPLDRPSPWQNPVDRLDVDGDFSVGPRDAMIIINFVNERGPQELPGDWTPPWDGPMWLDVNGDGCVTAADALLVLHQLLTEGPYRRPTDDEIHDAALTELLDSEEASPFEPLFDPVVGLLTLAG